MLNQNNNNETKETLNELTELNQKMQSSIDNANREFLDKLDKVKRHDFEYRITCEICPFFLEIDYCGKRNVGCISVRENQLKAFAHDPIKGDVLLVHVDTLGADNQGFGENFELLKMVEDALYKYLD